MAEKGVEEQVLAMERLRCKNIFAHFYLIRLTGSSPRHQLIECQYKVFKANHIKNNNLCF